MRTPSYLTFPAVVAATLLMTGDAAPAPQILGLTAQADPLHLQCADGVCTAELASFCLQKRRDDPEPGTPYTVHGDGRIDLHVRTTDGRRLTVSAKDRVN